MCIIKQILKHSANFCDLALKRKVDLCDIKVKNQAIK